MLKPIFENIPQELKNIPHWVNWRTIARDGKKTKPPYQPDGKLAKTDDPLTWNLFNAVKAVAPRYDGIGIVLTKDDPFVGLDFDECRCPAFDGVTTWANTLDTVLPEIADHIRRLNSYAEVSPSGKGIRVLLKGTLPADGKRKGPIEVYQSGRYMTVTGHLLEGFPKTIETRQIEVDAFYQTVFGTPDKPSQQEEKPRKNSTPCDWKALLEKAFASKNGPEIKRLYEGDFSSYSSQSEADLALCSHISFWLGRDAVAMDAAFRKSGLFREKWNEQHGPCTYGERTIQKAVAGCTSCYGDRQSQDRDPKETASPEAWQEPIPFNDYSNLPGFPVEAFPGVCGSMVQALSDSCQVDMGLPGSMMLAVLSAAIGARVKIVLATHTEQGNLYLLSVIGSGNRKSEVNSQLTAPLYIYQKARQVAMIPIIREAENRRRILEKRLEKLEREAAGEEDHIKRESIIRACSVLREEIEKNTVPRKPVYLSDDVTPERLGGIMAENDERAAILSAEGGFFKIIAGLYSKGNSNLDLILKAHTGDPWASDRVGRESQSMEHPALTLGLAVQPDVLEEIGRNSEFRGRGLSARFLYAWCQSKAGYRNLQTSPVPVSLKNDYHRLILSLLEIKGRHELSLTSAAQTIWNGFYADVEPLLKPGAELEHIVDWGSKLPGTVARISELLHFAEYGPKGIGKPISADSVKYACVLGAYYCEHAKAAFDIMKEDVRLIAARKILDYIKRQKPEKFKGRDVIRHTALATMEEVKPGLVILSERGYISPVNKSQGDRVGRPEADSYWVNPTIYRI